LFIYITHDTHFAAVHSHAEKIWVKQYDGTCWTLEKIAESTLPEQLVLDIMGNRREVLFVEGTTNSLDTKLYTEIYNNYYVVPCGGCSNVISQTKALRSTPQLHEIQCYGLIDKDYRSETEINAYKDHNIFTIKVAEVENLFLVEELLVIITEILAILDNKAIENTKKYISDNRFSQELHNQINEAVVSELKYRLSTLELSGKNEEETKSTLENAISTVSYDKIKFTIEENFNKVLASKNYSDILSIFNRKDLSKSVGHFFGLKDDEYCKFIIRQLKGLNAQRIKGAILPYLPSEIPIE
jgi:hypothetical protein